MNDMVPVASTELVLPQGTALAAAFRAENGIDPLIDMIAAEVRAHVPDTSTKKGRDAIASLAYRVSRSKTMLDEAGKTLNESARAEINIVDAARRKVRDALDALRDEARKPLVDWEAAEELRVNGLKARLRALDAGRADTTSSAAHIAAILSEVEAMGLGDDWQEFQGEAAIAKDKALTELRRNLDIATRREAEAAELARLREAQAKRDEEDRIRREVEGAAAKLAERAKNARIYIEQIGHGFIGGQLQPFAILIYELESKLPPLIDVMGEHADGLHALRIATLADATAAMERQRIEDETRAEEQRKAAAEVAAREAERAVQQKRAEDAARHERELTDAKRREDEAAQRERDRQAEERRVEAEAQRKREENTRIRNRVKREIAAAVEGLTATEIAEKLVAGNVPNCTVRM